MSTKHNRRPPPSGADGKPPIRVLRSCPASVTNSIAAPTPLGVSDAQLPAWLPIDDSIFDKPLYPSSLLLDGGQLLPLDTQSSLAQQVKPLHAVGPLSFDYFNFNPVAHPFPGPGAGATDTTSPPSSVSNLSSAASGLSPVYTEPQFDGQTLASTRSRGPSPLRQTVPAPPESDARDRFICLGPQCEETFMSGDDLEEHVKQVHVHACIAAGCDHQGFATKELMLWHVKLEHLLICPAAGCTETSFQNKSILESHIRVGHPEEWKAHNPAEPAQAAPALMPRHSSRGSEAATPKPCIPRDSEEDRKLKEYAVTVAKRKCREQLHRVVEKKLKRMAGTPRSIESPTDLFRSRTPRPLESASFPLVWEHGVLPFLVEFIPKWCGPGHVISVTRGRTPDSRRICIMTKKKVSRARRIVIASHVRDLLPEAYRRTSSFIFSTGEVNRLVWARGLSKHQPDDICPPRNPYYFDSPCMGDSIGIPGNDMYGASTATLGPCITVGEGNYWLANLHPFVDAFQHIQSVKVEHPSPCDRSLCLKANHDAIAEKQDFKIGALASTSGFDLKTTRITHDPYWEDLDKELPLIITDWSIISAKTQQANILRKFPSDTQPPMQIIPIKTASAVTPGATVCSSGRTSGHQRGQVCEVPAYVSGDPHGNGTGRATREWFIEEPSPYDNEDGWIRGGIGVEGDSGAAIIDADTNALIGQLWGRNKYFGAGPRHTFFTPIRDVFDDIQERCGQQGRPQLPQYRDEADLYSVYPSCRQCFDLRAYLDSRRSSRESLRSMIGPNESDQDLVSIEALSEATPKDLSYWVRHTGAEEAGTASFHSVVSPAPVNPFTSFGFATPRPDTPQIADIKSPYATTLPPEDLYDAEFAASPTDASGKRPALQLVRNGSSHGKRQRFG